MTVANEMMAQVHSFEPSSDSSWDWDGNLRLREVTPGALHFDVLYDCQQEAAMARRAAITETWFLRIYGGALVLLFLGLLVYAAVGANNGSTFLTRLLSVEYVLYSAAALLAPVVFFGSLGVELASVSAGTARCARDNRGRTMTLQVQAGSLQLTDGADQARRGWHTDRVVLLQIRPVPVRDVGPHAAVLLCKGSDSVVVYSGARSPEVAASLSAYLGVPLEEQTAKGRRSARPRSRWTRSSLVE